MKKRLFCLLLCALTLCTLLPAPAQATTSLYFTAVNDTLLDLSDKTMPFWQNGVLYIPSTVFENTDLGIACSFNRSDMLSILYKQRRVLSCDLSAGTIEDNATHKRYSGSAVLRDDVVFFPIAAIAEFFDLSYSCTKISYGYLVRLRSESAVLSDSMFIDAAAQPFQQRYTQYLRTQAANETGSTAGDSANGDSAAQRGSLTLYPLVRVTEHDACAQLLSQLAGYGFHLTLLFGADTDVSCAPAARRAVSGGHALALLLQAETVEDARAEIERANGFLWDSANVQTRLLYAPNLSSDARKALQSAGYCPISSVLDLSRTGQRWPETVLSRAGQSSALRVYLGSDQSASRGLASALSRLYTERCTLTPLNELSA